MKILVLSGGASSLNGFRLPLIKRFVADGNEVVAAACEDNSTVREDLAAAGVRFVPLSVGRVSVNPLGDAIFVLKLLRFFRREKFDLAFLFQQKAILYGGIAAKLAGIPRIFAMVTGLGYAFMPRPGLKFRIVNAVAGTLYKIATRCFDGMIFQNPDDMAFMREKFLKHSRVPVKRVYGSGVDLTEFSFRENFDAGTFLFVGRLVADKGICEYIRAGEILANAGSVAELRIVGGLDLNPSAISEAQLRGWENRGACKYLGKVRDVRPLVAAAAVFVLPSYREGTPRSALEAMAIGRPIITTNVPGCREVVFFENGCRRYLPEKREFENLPAGTEPREHEYDILAGDNGFLVPAKNAEALANAMNFFLENPEAIRFYGRKSRRLAEKFYDVEKVNDDISKFMKI